MRNRIAALATAEWLLVLPAGVFLTAAALRLLQPRQFEPSRTSWRIFEWTSTHMTHGAAALLFLGLPALACAIGAAVLLRLWQSNVQLRNDVKTALAIVWRNIAVGLLACAFVAAAGILAMSVVHMITD